jgi:gamma-glutamyltranspeptidase/glutathione hydrolase
MRTRRLVPALGLLLTVGLTVGPVAGADPGKVPVVTGYGGAVVSDTIESTQAGWHGG